MLTLYLVFAIGSSAVAGESRPALAKGRCTSARDVGLDEAEREHSLGNFVRAEGLLRRLAGELEAEAPVDAGRLGVVLGNLASVRHDQAEYAEAETLGRRSLPLIASAYGPSDQRHAIVLAVLSLTLCEEGRCNEGEKLARQALAFASEVCGEDDRQYATILGIFGGILYRQGGTARVMPIARRVVAILEAKAVPADAELAHAHHNLAVLLSQKKDYPAAREHLHRATSIWAGSLRRIIRYGWSRGTRS